jgi:RNA-directed DNA polymerase
MIVLEHAKTQPISKRQVWDAWKRVRTGGKATGVDCITIAEIEVNHRKYLYPLWNRLASGCYMPPPVREKSIPKGNGKERILGIPTILDRVAQEVIRAELEPLVEPKFLPSSFGYRPRKSAHQALEQCAKNCWERWYVVDLDIKGFFDNINHERMMEVLRKHTDKKHILLYCERWLKAQVMKPNGTLEDRGAGTPQGGVISPLLANLYLHEVFDRWLTETQPLVVFERYADDIVVHTRSPEQSALILDKIRSRLKEFSLTLSEEKTKVVYCWRTARFHKDESGCSQEFDFLGHTFRPRLCLREDGEKFWGFRPAISDKNKKKIQGELRQMSIHNWAGTTIQKMAKKLAPKLRGWINYFTKFRPSEMDYTFWKLNVRIMKWARKKYKLLTVSKSYAWLKRVCKTQPDLFVHWSKGYSV